MRGEARRTVCSDREVQPRVRREARRGPGTTARRGKVPISSSIEGIRVIHPVADDLLAATELRCLRLAHDDSALVDSRLHHR